MIMVELNIDQKRLIQICQAYSVARLEVFGSFAEGTASEESDLDLLVTFGKGAALGLGFVRLPAELSSLTGRNVDLHERRMVERSPNKYFRSFALEHTEQLYAA